jgi:surface protein
VVNFSEALGSRSDNNLNFIQNWNVSHGSNFNGIFASQTMVKDIDLSAWNMSNARNLSNFFMYCYNLTNVNLTGWDTGNVSSFDLFFYDDNRLKDIKGIEN